MRQTGVTVPGMFPKGSPGLAVVFALGLLFLSAPSLASTEHMSGEHGGAISDGRPDACLEPDALPSPQCGRTPSVAFDGEGLLWLAFSQQGHIYVTRSADLGKSFAPVIAVNSTPELIYHDGENRPKIALGPEGEVYVSWTRRTEGRFAGDIILARSLDGAKSFDMPLVVNSDRSPISHRFETLLVDRNGRIHLLWIDKRDLVAARKADRPYRGAALYYAMSDDRGASIAFNRNLADHSCECCRIAAKVTGDGRIAALWRHVYPGQIRDHAIAFVGPDLPAAGADPIRATRDNWYLEGCPHHGPDLSAGSKDIMHIAWFTNGEDKKGLRVGRFNMRTERLEVEHELDPSPAASRPQILAAGGVVTTIWKRFAGDETELLVRTSHNAGTTWSAPFRMAATKSGSDHPILISRSGQVFASWHTQAEGYRLIPVQHVAESE